jgi:hypothetical protein
MTLAPIQVFQKASELGINLGVERPDTLTVKPAERCPKDFVPVLKENKSALLALLRLPFVMVYSEVLPIGRRTQDKMHVIHVVPIAIAVATLVMSWSKLHQPRGELHNGPFANGGMFARRVDPKQDTSVCR